MWTGVLCLFWLAKRMIWVVKVFHQFGAFLLLLVFSAAPAMACLAPNAAMTAPERSCCRMMKNDCGQAMEMPASHSCCQKASKAVNEVALKTRAVSVPPLMFTVRTVSSLDLVAPHDAGTGWVQRPELAPPKAPPCSISVLRL
jgi:hypothetical protein